MNLYEQLITLLPDVPVTTLSPVLMGCYNLGTIAFFIFLIRLVALLTIPSAKYSRWSWGVLLGIFVFGRAMTTMQLVFHKSLILSLEISILAGAVVALISYVVVPAVTGMLSSVFKD